MKPFVTQVWPQFTADQQFCAAFGSVLVDRVELYRTQRQVVICLRSAEPLDQALCGRLCASLAEVFAGYELQVRSYCAYPNITPEAVRLMIEELKEKGMPVNGFLDKSEPVTFGEDGITPLSSAGPPDPWRASSRPGKRLRDDPGAHRKSACCPPDRFR